MIKVITFDLWDTVFIDDSDEPKRKAAGRLSKREERRFLIHQYATKHKVVTKELVDTVYDTADAAFSKVWHGQFVTWTVAERMEIIFKGLGIKLLSGEMDEIVKLHEEMELEFRPDFVDRVGEALAELHKFYKLGVISDAIFSPGRVLRELLKGEDLLKYFDHFVFSDEIGCSKPNPAVFVSAYKSFGIKPEEMVHIGDRESNDIAGPKDLGIHALLCIASINRGTENTQADAIFSQYKDLTSIVSSIK